MNKKREKESYSTKKRKKVAYEIIAHDLNFEIADELLIHDEFIPEYFNLVSAEEQRRKVDELEKVTKKGSKSIVGVRKS